MALQMGRVQNVFRDFRVAFCLAPPITGVVFYCNTHVGLNSQNVERFGTDITKDVEVVIFLRIDSKKQSQFWSHARALLSICLYLGRVIGADETVLFDIELVAFVDDKKIDESFDFVDLDLDKDGLLSRDEVGHS